MSHSCGVLRFAATGVFERNDAGHKWFLRRFPCFDVGVGEDKSFVLYDFEIHAAIGEVLAFRASHDKQTGTACPDICLNDRRSPGLWGEPLFELFRIGPRLEDASRRRIDNAGEDQFTVSDGSDHFEAERSWLELQF